ncbi:MAG: hypothetical protein J5494_02590 [Candidatus Methanomethylophilaceae archaeon]|nr:hypothetical protein [Candidatus Methanomethylophilaceae archaeon]
MAAHQHDVLVSWSEIEELGQFRGVYADIRHVRGYILGGETIFLGDVPEDVPVVVGQLVPCFETGAIAGALRGGSVLPEPLTDPLLHDPPYLAADGRVLAEEIEVAETFAVKEDEALVGKGPDLVSDVLLFAEEACVLLVVFHVG